MDRKRTTRKKRVKHKINKGDIKEHEETLRTENEPKREWI